MPQLCKPVTLATARMTGRHMDEISLRRYAELVIRVGLNLQPGQRLLIIGPLANGGVSLDAAPLVRAVAAQAYRAGAQLVEVLWGDEPLLTLRFRHAPRDSFGQFSAWLPGALPSTCRPDTRACRSTRTIPTCCRHEPPSWSARCSRRPRKHDRRFASSSPEECTPTGPSSPRPAAAWAAQGVSERRPRTSGGAALRGHRPLCRLDRPIRWPRGSRTSTRWPRAATAERAAATRRCVITGPGPT